MGVVPSELDVVIEEDEDVCNHHLDPNNQIEWEPNNDPSLQDDINVLNSNTNTQASTQHHEVLGGATPSGECLDFSEVVGVMQNQPSTADQSISNETQRGDGVNVLRRETFNNIQLSSVLTFPQNNDVTDYATFYRGVLGSLKKLTQMVTKEARPGDIIQLELSGESANQHTSFTFRNDAGAVMNAFQDVLDLLVQSNVEILNDEEIQVMVQVIHNPRGGVRRKIETLLEHEIHRKKARYLYNPLNSNNQLCFAISLASLLHPEFTDSQAVAEAEKIQRKAGLDEQTSVTFSHIREFEKVVRRKIVIMFREEGQRPLSRFETDYPKSENPLYLYLSQNHYSGIINIKGFLSKPHVCHYCYQGYDKPDRHKCDGYCLVCTQNGCVKIEGKTVLCRDCNMWCRSPACLLRHRVKHRVMEKLVSNCDRRKKCLKCNLFYDVPVATGIAKHTCPKLKCQICKEELPRSDSETPETRHLCYIQPQPREVNHNDNIIFYDFETFVDDNHTHIPFLVCTKTLQGEEWCAFGLDCVTVFLNHFRKPRYLKSTFIAHNSRGFDGYLILRGMVRLGIAPLIIMQGSKVLCFKDPDFLQKYIDSLSFLTMPLSAMPKALGLGDCWSKGYFPHKFSSEEHLNYVGKYPAISNYGVERMTPVERTKFETWYQNEKSEVFDFQKQAVHYCKNDVNVLREGCIKFRAEFTSETGVDPFSRITIASACMKVFVTNFLEPRSLAIPSPDNYRGLCKKYSHTSIQWLEWESHRRGIFIQHALNKGEKQMGAYFVDGFAIIGGKPFVWEFQGCFYHGCPTCFEPGAVCPLTNTPFEELHKATEKKMKALKRDHKVNIIVIREHEWNEMKKSNPRVIDFLKTRNYPAPLMPRDALYGGRTSAFCLRHTAGENQRVLYEDVTSLYPYVNSAFPYPLGHPVIIHTDFDDVGNYFGLVRAVVHPPRGLYFPVLPYRTVKGKLVFTLCRTCAENNNQQEPCEHDEEGRALTGVWVTLEFNKALQLGYRVGKITEVWHFEERSETVFTGYVQTFLKGKQEASGYPKEAVDAESREKYIREYRENQGIQLDAEKIDPNPAKRQMSKLCLNSLWGKFAERCNRTQTTLVRKSEVFFDFVFSGKYQVEYFSFLNEQIAMVQWQYSKNSVVLPGNTNNVFVAAFTTAYARLKMYGYLEGLQERVLYTDTDSLIYTVNEGEVSLETGSYLGDLTDELGGDSIHEFVSAGPKSYAYHTLQGKKTVLRAKGITQTRECCERVNFDSVKDLVEGYLEEDKTGAIYTPHHQIVRDKRGFLLNNSSFEKKFRVVYDKRRLFPDGKTLPFGY
ncbi:uncharacterized protein LOC133557872 isoform X1 [Nerophis ophidion]|uniref:uncharacterized protein LOC133557872 isoform X1 n=1 Tax=Nerophis ophidion TaxID=159077 RepID=UPI002ADF8DFC|nr:uncharacterized protein LOC133557872 isoform X1 [Nerophis ophidion]XP_061764741.1 uncharacterized protein LOC133557872 isoform X1 [Nerophis ophidion]XP_061764743.1 uncharacterized protein LOC133557872 isoform X1 [Nerophis ophidion]XP_061764744.1 uncharacterized protein LOC133557872 isoform X1 [Nerophis ophidion]